MSNRRTFLKQLTAGALGAIGIQRIEAARGHDIDIFIDDVEDVRFEIDHDKIADDWRESPKFDGGYFIAGEKIDVGDIVYMDNSTRAVHPVSPVTVHSGVPVPLGVALNSVDKDGHVSVLIGGVIDMKGIQWQELT